MNFGFRAEAIGVNTGTSLGTSVLSGGTPNVKGSWVELTAACAFDVDYFMLNAVTASTTGPYLLDIGVGAGGSEVVLIPDIVWDNSDGGFNNLKVPYPISIPLGTRIAVRGQAKSVNKDHNISMTLISSGARAPYGKVAALGILSSGDTGHFKLVPSATAHVKGSWLELSASTPFDCREIILFFGRANLTRLSEDYFVDIGIGTGGSEVVILPDMRVRSAGSPVNSVWPQYVGPIPLEIPAGTRVAARCQCSATSGQNVGCSVHIIG